MTPRPLLAEMLSADGSLRRGRDITFPNILSTALLDLNNYVQGSPSLVIIYQGSRERSRIL
jgi:hypothetical protein